MNGIVDTQAILATGALGVMCVIMYLLSRIARRRLGVGSGTVAPDAVRVVGKKPLDQKSALWIVEVGGRHLLLGTGSDGSVSKLDDISDEQFARMRTDEGDGGGTAGAVVSGAADRLRRTLRAVPAADAAVVAAGGEDDVEGDAAGTVADEVGAAGATTSPATVDDEPAVAEEQRFATVGESFSHLLGKAREARGRRQA